MPSAYSLSDAYPNPFNPSTTINYSLSEEGLVSITIYDISGRIVDELVSENKNPGSYDVIWNANNHATGVYFVKLSVNGFTETNKLMLIK